VRAPVAGGEIETVEAGSGPPLLLLPSLPGWKETYVALLPRLAARFRVLTFDLRSRFRGQPSWPELLDDVSALAERLGPGPLAVMGHSLGAALALHWAAEHPERVRALILSSGFVQVFTPRRAWGSRYLEQPFALAGMRWLPETLSARFARGLAARRRWVFDGHCEGVVTELTRFGVRRVPLRLVRERIRIAFGLDLRASLASVGCPTLILRGERDTEFVRESAIELEAGIRGATSRTIGGAGHLHPLSRPDELAAVVSHWLESLPTPAGHL
jgi:pimeloyl-ACP methyl ester carboxylesterase